MGNRAAGTTGKAIIRGLAVALTGSICAIASAQEDTDVAALRADAAWMLDLIEYQYAYLDRFEGRNPALGALGVDIESINTRLDLLTFGECALNALKDHHAFMGPSTGSSPGLAPSYSDLWIDQIGGGYVVAEVRAHSPAQRAGVRPGWVLVSVDDEPVDDQIDRLCGGPFVGPEERGFAARMVAIGPRDQSRRLGFETPDGERVDLELNQLYDEQEPWPGPVTHELRDDGIVVLTVHDGLGEDAWRSALDEVFRSIAEAQLTGVLIDLRDTPGGGNTDNARALLGRFVDDVVFYQRHSYPVAERITGVRRSWVEEVSPLEPDLSTVPVVVLVGRWTGSMGEGTAIGFDAITDATIMGTEMAQLRGAVYDHVMPNTGWTVKLPTERLYHVNGTPREAIVPEIVVRDVEARPGEDRGLSAAFQEIRRRIDDT